MRSGPNGDVQLTPMPTDSRGFAELPRNSSLNPGEAAYSVESQAGSRGPRSIVVNPVVASIGVQMLTTSISWGFFTFHTDPTSTKADGRRPTLLRPEVTGNSSSSRP